jgi:hypothetical protein
MASTSLACVAGDRRHFQLGAGFDHAGQQFGCFNHGRIDGLLGREQLGGHALSHKCLVHFYTLLKTRLTGY